MTTWPAIGSGAWPTEYRPGSFCLPKLQPGAWHQVLGTLQLVLWQGAPGLQSHTSLVG